MNIIRGRRVSSVDISNDGFLGNDLGVSASWKPWQLAFVPLK